MATFYHVAGTGYTQGESLWCADELMAQGVAVSNKYGGDAEWVDTDIISLFSDLSEAQWYQGEYGGTLLTVTLPDDEQERKEWGIVMGHNAEGYTYVQRTIDARWIEG